jgi:hypothetical protein
VIDEDDKKQYDFSIDLKEVSVVNLDSQRTKIDLDSGVGIIMKYPAYELLEQLQDMKFDDVDDLFEIIYMCIDMIYDEDQIFPAVDLDKEELRTWLSTMNSKKFAKIVEFFEEMPKLQHVLKYTNSNGIEKEVTLQGVTDFFV